MKAIWPLEEAITAAHNPASPLRVLRHLRNNLCLVQVPRPRPRPSEVLIRVRATGVNRADLLQAGGHYPPPTGASRALGLECSGTVEELGEHTPRELLGQAVCALLDGGGYAEFVRVPAQMLLPLPRLTNRGSLTEPTPEDFAAGASLPEAAATAWSNLVTVSGLQKGQRVLIHGGSGGVGSLAVQIASRLGAEVWATAGTSERCRQVESLGTIQAFNYRYFTPDKGLQATSGYGFDLILDVTGAGGLDQNLRLLATQGKLVIIGLQKGTRAELNLGLLLERRTQIIGTTLRSRPAQEKTEIVSQLRQHLWPLIEEGTVQPLYQVVQNTTCKTPSSPLELAALAHQKLAEKTDRPFGKLVLTLD